MQATHGKLVAWQRNFEQDRNTRSQRFFRVVNEVPTVLMVGIVILVVLKPF
ncbi:MAG: CopD family protein [Ferrovibrio sp.]